MNKTTKTDAAAIAGSDMLTPVYSVETLHNYTGECYWTPDKKYTICHYPNLKYWEVREFGTMNINNYITRESTLKLCVDTLNRR